MKQFTATVTVAYGTGGYKLNPHKYWGATRTAISNSPKTAVRLAMEAANRACGEGASWIPIMQTISISKNGKIIFVTM